MAENVRKTYRYLVYSIISVVLLLYFSYNTSPITSAFGLDSSFFILVGRGMKEGLLPYEDFFDMKGPYLFLLEYLGQLICNGRTGAFIVQCVNLISCLCIIDSILVLAVNDNRSVPLKKAGQFFLIGILPFLFFFFCTFEGGNLTEELSLAFLLSAMKMMLLYFKKAETTGNYAHTFKYGFLYGFFFGILSLIRITNAYLIGAILLTVTIELIIHKEFKNLIYNGAFFIFGTCVAFLPMIIFFGANGLLMDMLYQVFAFGFTYSTEEPFIEKIIAVIIGSPRLAGFLLLPFVISILSNFKERKILIFSVSALALLILAISLGNTYLHYYNLSSPFIVFASYLILKNLTRINKKRKVLLVTLSSITLIVLLPLFSHAVKRPIEKISSLEDRETYSQVQDIISHIPLKDSKDIYAYLSSCSRWYEMSKTLPPYKYCDWQRHYTELSPMIKSELLQYLSEATPKWIVTCEAMRDEGDDIYNTIADNYTVYVENDSYILYLRNGE